MGGVIDMRRFRGLRHRLPRTYVTFAVGGLALSGIFPLAGFWSKDEILAAVKSASHEAGVIGLPGWSGIYVAVYWVAVFTAFLTAFYTGRAFFLTFWGPEKLPSPADPEAGPDEARAHATDAHGAAPDAAQGAHADGHETHLGHESPPIMTIPLLVLAVCAGFVGIIFGPTGLFAGHLERTPGFGDLGHSDHGFDWVTAFVGTLVGLVGLALSWWMYAKPSDVPARLAERLRPLYEASYRKFGIDTLYDWVVVSPTRGLAIVCKYLDIYLVDNLIVRGAAWLPRYVARDWLAPFQNGLIQFYAAVAALSVALLLLALLIT